MLHITDNPAWEAEILLRKLHIPQQHRSTLHHDRALPTDYTNLCRAWQPNLYVYVSKRAARRENIPDYSRSQHAYIDLSTPLN